MNKVILVIFSFARVLASKIRLTNSPIYFAVERIYFMFASLFRFFAMRLVLLLMLPLGLPAAVQAQTQADCQLSTPAFARMQIVRIALQNDRQQRININSHIADEPSERAAGYQHICASVIERTSILFRYPATTAGRFHMRNVKAPLDIGFFDERGILLQYQVMHPYSADAANQGTEILYDAIQAFQYALEARHGFFKENQLSAGSARLLLETLPLE